MIKGINHITLSVSNLERSFLFYKEVLGLTPKFKSSTTAYFEDGSLWLALSLDEHTRKSELNEYTHIAFDVDEHSFNELSQKIKNSKASIFKENRSEGSSLYFLDPDGHKLEIHVGSIKERIDHYKKHVKDDFQFEF